jgi:predicted phage-related endonuclease
LKNLKNAQKNIEKKIEFKENEIMMILKEKENLMYFGDVLATWKSNEVNRFDTKEFQAKHPDIYQQYLKSNVQRRFLIK